jgi:hypothetical protein
MNILKRKSWKGFGRPAGEPMLDGRQAPVIETELWKSPLLRGYFEDWGSRCYLFSAELGPIFAVRKDTPPPAPVSQLWLNTSALRALGASYLFSAVQIQDAKSLRLRGVGIVRDKNAAMSLYIYAL